MRLFLGIVIAALLAGMAGSVAGRHFHSPSPRVEESPDTADPLAVFPEDLDFGEVWETATLDRVVRVRNPGDIPVEVNQIRSSCNCLAVQPSSFVLEPGATRELHVRLDLRSKSDQDLNDFHVHLSPVCNSTEFKIRWTLKGRVRRYLRVDDEIYSRSPFGTFAVIL